MNPSTILRLLICCACAAPLAALDVVATTSDLADLAGSIGRERVAVSSLQNGTRDPHFLQARPSFIAKARRADLWLRVGMDLEVGYEPLILKSSRNPAIRLGSPGHLDLSTVIHRLDVPEGEVDRSMGDVHPHGNPHWWLDPHNGRLAAAAIADRLTRLDPEGGETYRANLAAFERRLDEAMFGQDAVAAFDGAMLWEHQAAGTLDEALGEAETPAGGWYALLRPHAGMAVISHHRSWNYLLDRFDLRLVAELEPKPGIPPSSRHLSTVMELAKNEQARVILVEPFYDRAAADQVARKVTGVQVLVRANATGGQPEAHDYITMLDRVLRGLATALGQP